MNPAIHSSPGRSAPGGLSKASAEASAPADLRLSTRLPLDADAAAAPRVEDRAALLLSRVAAPPPLGPAALSRIEARLLADTAPRASRFRLAVMAPALAGFCGVLVGALLLRGVTPGKLALLSPRPACQGAACDATHDPSREVRVPAGASARLWLPSALPSALGAELTLLGPGLVRLPQGPAQTEATEATAATAQPLTLSAGRLLVRAGRSALVVAVSGGTVTVHPGSAAEIEIAQRRGVRVAAYVGSCSLSLGGGAEAVVSAGSSWTAEGETAVEPARRTEALLRLGVAPEETPAAEAAVADSSAAAEPGSRPATGSRPGPSRPRPRHSEAHPLAGVGASSSAEVGAPSPTDPPAVTADAEPAAPARPAAPTSLQQESLLLGQALQHLRRERDGERALASLDDYQQRFPAGALVPEAAAARVDALLLLGRSAAALQQLERLDLSDSPRRAELTVLRGELRGRAGRDAGALADFTQALNDGVEGALLERALYGRARSKAHGGDVAGAQEDLRRYLTHFPSGKFSDEAREAVGK